MTKDRVLAADAGAQMIVLIGFLIALVIIGMGTIIYSSAVSGYVDQQSGDAHVNFLNAREEYGTILMFVSDEGNHTPFNTFNSTIMELESSMKNIMASHGYMLNFTWGAYNNSTPPTAEVTILLANENSRFEDTVTYDLQTGRIIYDLTPPGTITDLDASTGDFDGDIRLTWTASGDDGYSGKASKYEIRYSNESIDTLEEFYNANYAPINFNPDINGTLQEFTVRNLDPGRYYFAVIVYDEVMQFSSISNSPWADAANWRPAVENITAEDLNTGNSSVNLTTDRMHNVTIRINVSDKEHDTLDISLYFKNVSGSWNRMEWLDEPWTNYSTMSYYHTLDSVTETWYYYANVTDDKGYSTLEPVPPSYYSINGSYSTVAGNVSVTGISNNSINISAPFGGDFNNNNDISVLYRINISMDPWSTPDFIATRGQVDHTVRILSLNSSTGYDINITYLDDGFEGPNPNIQLLYNVSTLP